MSILRSLTYIPFLLVGFHAASGVYVHSMSIAPAGDAAAPARVVLVPVFGATPRGMTKVVIFETVNDVTTEGIAGDVNLDATGG